ncbi:hypothetical protein MRX96_000600 [Rhipicephalus microplus]
MGSGNLSRWPTAGHEASTRLLVAPRTRVFRLQRTLVAANDHARRQQAAGDRLMGHRRHCGRLRFPFGGETAKPTDKMPGFLDVAS